jgi:ATP-dependent helicase HepA
MAFAPGQRWLSLAEPELGLGTVLRVEHRTVQVAFAATGTVRAYATHAAPLQRAQFRAGDKVAGGGRSFVVERVESSNGVLRYVGAGDVLAEGELDDVQDLSKADERLMAGRVDAAERFDFRAAALMHRAHARRSLAWGLMSARIDLIAHQLRVAEVVARRRPVRVLLADEVGLGKTIEAGMILAQMLAGGRIERALIVLPETLVYQWFVELLRRFNLQFSVFDEERCEAIELSGDRRNPFLDEQLVLVDIAFLRDSPRRAEQALGAGWDLLVVDEAHHLAWSPDAASREYGLIEGFARATTNLILLTATPEQLGRTGHFARLRLLDAARYGDLERFQHEAESYAQLSQIVEKLQEGAPLSDAEQMRIATMLRDDVSLVGALAVAGIDGTAASAVLDALIDRHGTGRVMFRNRRAAVGGFPQRIPQMTDLAGGDFNDDFRQHLLVEFLSDAQQPPAVLALDYASDPRLAWLIDLLERHATEKFLLICRSQVKVVALEDALRTRSTVKLARFHEAMTIVQRDRNAAYFAEEDGARLLLCAEIGSEGRNFQFAHHLVLWDLPLDPDLLEQRIGRLDRIGQRGDIHIHIAVVPGSAQQAVLRWYDSGLDALRSSPADGRELYKRFGERLHALAVEHARGGEDTDAEIDSIVAETRAAHAELSTLIQKGRDRLLELASQREARLQLLYRALATADADRTIEDFVLRLFEQFGVENEDQGRRTYLLDPEYLSTDGFPGLHDGPQTVTFDRATALVREDLPFLGADHPMVTGALDLLLGGELGNAAFLVDDTLPARNAVLQCIFILDPVAASSLQAQRFLPPLPIRCAVDTKLGERSEWRPGRNALARAGERSLEVSRYRKFLAALVPPMLKRCEELARKQANREIADAVAAAERELGAEHDRLVALARVNAAVRAEEIDAVAQELGSLRDALPQALLRLDALRFVCSADFLSLR